MALLPADEEERGWGGDRGMKKRERWCVCVWEMGQEEVECAFKCVCLCVYVTCHS